MNNTSGQTNVTRRRQTAPRRPAPPGRRRSVVSVLAVAAAMTVPLAAPAQAAPTCADSSPQSGAYTVTVCVQDPAPGAVVQGDVAVTATAAVTSGGSGISRMTFLLDGQDLLVDYDPPYTFVLPTDTFADGTKSMQVRATMRDNFVSAPTTVSLEFANGRATPPPVPTGFTPTTGTAPAAGKPFVLAATGDGASGQTSSDAVVSAVEAMAPNMFMYTGDVYDDGTYTEFKNWYGEGERYGRLASITNPILGNHEQDGTTWAGYDRYWKSPPPFYSYDAAGWHFVVFNSDDRFMQLQPGTPQFDWLAQDLAANDAQCTIAGFHHPVVSVGPQGDNPELNQVWQLLADNGVDIALTGHDHSYQRWAPLGAGLQPNADGVTQFVLGGGGHGIQAFSRTDSRMVAGADTVPNAYGALRLELNSNGAAFEYRNTQGSALDSGTVPCTGAGADTTAPSAPSDLRADAVHGGQVDLTWSASTDDVGVDHYVVRRNGVPIGTTPAHQRSYSDTTVRGATTYTYTVVAVDAADNTSPASNQASVTTPGSSQTLTFTASADGYVNSSSPGTNYGASTVLRLDSSPDMRSYLAFDLSGISGSVDSVKLRVHSNSNHSMGYEVRSAPSTWNESTLTYTNAPAAEDLLSGSGPLAAGTYEEIDLTGKVPMSGRLSLALTPLNPTALSLASRESATSPELVVQQTPNDNRAPVAEDGSVDTQEDTGAQWTPAVSDPDGDPLSCAIAAPPSHGDASVAADCSAGSFTPAADYSGTDSFTFAVTDGTTTVHGTIDVSVGPVNDPPVVAAGALTLTEGTTRSVRLTATDVDGDCPLVPEVVTAPGHGTLGSFENLTCSGGAAQVDVALTIPRGYSGPDSFQVAVVDPAGERSAPATVSVTVVPRQTSFTLNPTADSYVDAGAATSNFGASSQLRVDSKPLVRSYLKFEVPELTGEVLSATLRVYSGTKDSTGYRFHGAGTSWDELGITHNNAPAPGAVLGSSGAITNNGYNEVDVTAYVRATGPVGFALLPLKDANLKLWARESGRPPVLLVRTD
jgi:hypothetical protein